MIRPFFILFMILPSFVFPQIQTGKWREHLSYSQGIQVVAGNQKVYCATPTGIFWYGLNDLRLGKISRIDGLNDINISAIEYIKDRDYLIVGYENGNLDIVTQDRIIALPDIKNKIMQGSKRINDFCPDDDMLYVSTDFGIVVVDIDKNEIKETFFIGTNGESTRVYGTAISGTRIYAATDIGLLSAQVDDPLIIHYESWVRFDGFIGTTNPCLGVIVYGSNVVAIEGNSETEKDIIWSIDNYGSKELGRPFNTIRCIQGNENRFIISSREGLSMYSSLNFTPENIYGYGFTSSFEPNSAVPIGSEQIAISDQTLGMVFGEPGNLFQVCPNGPVNNRAFSIGLNSERVIVAAGAYDASYTNMWYQYSFHTFHNEQWESVQDWNHHDAIRVVFNPGKPDEYFIATWGHGIFRYSGDKLVARYNQDNSTLQTIFPGAPYCRISGMTFDNKGNLWAANPMVPNPISVRRVDTTWISFPLADQINSDRLSDLASSSGGQLWLILPNGGGLFILNPGSDIADVSDDDYKKVKLSDNYGNSLPNDINAIAFDLDGYLWIGTTEGVLINYNPENIFENSMSFQRVKVPDVIPGIAAYLLENETITSICVDGGNRKWFGTSKSGIFLQSADGSEEIYHFNMQNSPLPSDNILDIKVHPTTGEVFIVTEKGLVSYRGQATKANSSFKKVYAFPNPVRPDYSGDIIITGLVQNTLVKITDISGNLVFETHSLGGQAVWNGKNFNGNRVATGIYLIFCTDERGEQAIVAKLLFIK